MIGSTNANSVLISSGDQLNVIDHVTYKPMLVPMLRSSKYSLGSTGQSGDVFPRGKTAITQERILCSLRGNSVYVHSIDQVTKVVTQSAALFAAGSPTPFVCADDLGVYDYVATTPFLYTAGKLVDNTWRVKKLKISTMAEVSSILIDAEVKDLLLDGASLFVVSDQYVRAYSRESLIEQNSGASTPITSFTPMRIVTYPDSSFLYVIGIMPGGEMCVAKYAKSITSYDFGDEPDDIVVLPIRTAILDAQVYEHALYIYSTDGVNNYRTVYDDRGAPYSWSNYCLLEERFSIDTPVGSSLNYYAQLLPGATSLVLIYGNSSTPYIADVYDQFGTITSSTLGICPLGSNPGAFIGYDYSRDLVLYNDAGNNGSIAALAPYFTILGLQPKPLSAPF